jgi:hypothetical protein
MAIYPSQYNAIDFSKRKDDSNRVKNVLPSAGFRYISFFGAGVVDETTAKITIHGSTATDVFASIAEDGANAGEWYFYFEFDTELTSYLDEDVYFSASVDGVSIYSEYYTIRSNEWMEANNWVTVLALNSDDRHGFLSRESTAFFKTSPKINDDFFINEEVVYEYSYNRKRILSSENSKAKRYTFEDLTLYNQILLRWLCKCETLAINGDEMQQISDFTEILADEKSEIKSLRADFVFETVDFFDNGETDAPSNIFTKQFFTK